MIQTPSRNIPMVDLKGQYAHIAAEVDAAVLDVIRSAYFIKGPVVRAFETELAEYLGVKHVIACANGTDALQIALMALGFEPGDEILVPAFTYVATAEVIALLQLKAVMVDCDPHTYTMRVEDLEGKVTAKTKAIVPVHLYGQSADMEGIMGFAERHNLKVIEDNAQAIGANYTFSDGRTAKTGTIGHIGCTSFFPSKNLGCFGDGGAIMTNDVELAAKLSQIANHGQGAQYYHEVVGVNSRLDAIQAAVLRIKLRHLDGYGQRRRAAANAYDSAFAKTSQLQTPTRSENSTHVFHQYTLRVLNGRRDELREHLKKQGIAHNVYYPLPLYVQKAFAKTVPPNFNLPNTELLCQQVISLPMHTELDEETLDYIIESVNSFFN
jgi:dTDP-4-amino-4,6-dideoxygalactose transaminase